MASVSYIPASTLIDLMRSADVGKNLYVRVLENQLVLGMDPFHPTSVVDFSNEKIRPIENGEEVAKSVEIRLPRRSGEYWLEILGRRIECRSLKELLSEGLRALEDVRPGTLEKLSHIKPRSRRIVARNRHDLFDRGHLAKDFAEKLMDGWWFGTNNSANETESWLERACGCSGLKWGGEFKTNL